MFMSRPSIGNRLLRGSIGLSPVFATLIASQPGQVVAATIAPNNLVSVCSGVSLPASAVTNIVAPVINGVVTPLQSGLNGLLGPLLGVNVGAAGLLSSAAAGQPISLQAIATDGTVLGSNSSCYSQANGYTLATPAGLSIGGNQITGLGSGATASAGELNSIAFGNNAVTAPTTLGAGAIAIGNSANVGAAGTGAVALGNSASVLGANGVAMGNGATVGLGGSGAVALGNSASVLGANSVALGNGANVGLLGTNSVALGNGASATTANSVAIGGNSVANRLVLPGAPAEVSIGATGAERQLTHLAAGTADTDAVNLAQLNVVSGNVATNTQNIATLTTNVASDGVKIGTLQTGLATANANVGQLQTGLATANANVGLLQSGLSTANANIGSLQTSVTANTAGLGLANSNIAGLQGTVTANTSSIGQLQTGLATTNGTVGALQTSVNANTAGLTTANGNIATLTTNVASDGVKIGTLQTGLATANGNIGALQTSVTANTAGLMTATNSIAANVADIATLKTNVGTNTADIGTLNTNVAANTSGLNALANAAVQYDNAGHTSLSLGGTGSAPVALANVKAGALTVDSTQAVNGAQLLDTNNAVSANNTQIATLSGKILQNTGDITTANLNIASLGVALAQNTTATNTNTTDIANLTTTVNDNSNLLTVQGNAIGLNANAIIKLRDDTANGAVGPVQYSNPATPTVPNGGTKTNDLTLVGRDPLPVQLHNVGDGVVAAGSKDGVNGGQLFALQNSLGSLSDLAVQYDDPTRNSVTLGNALGGPVALRNIQAGTLSATSNDAVNGAQLFNTNQTVTNQGDQLTTLNTQVTSGAIGPVQYSTAAAPTTPSGLGASQDLTLVGLNANPVGLHNIAQGTLSATSTDAVNGAQLFATNTQINSLAGLSVQYDNGQHNRVTFGGPLAPAVTLSNVANGTIAANSTEAVNGGQLFALSNQVGASAALAVEYDDAARNRITLASAAGTPVALSGVAPATLTATSTDAVNGGQLYDTNQTVAGLQTQVTTQTNQYQTLNNSYLTLNTQIGTGSIGPVRYSSVTDPTTPNGGTISQDLTLVGANAGTVGLHNVADGTLSGTSTDAVNGAQLFATNQAVTNIRTDLGSQGDLLNTLNLQVTNNTTALGNINTTLNQLNIAVSNGGIGPVQYSDSTDPTTPNGGTRSQDLTLVGASSGGVALHNVAPGVLSMTSLDAVNGSQLAGLGAATASVFGGNYAFNAASNSFSGSFSYGGNSYASIQSVLGAIQSNVAINGGSDDGSIPASTKYFHTTSTMTDSTALGADSTAIGPTSTSSGVASISVGRNSNALGNSSVAIGDGATAQDGKAVSIGVGNMASGDGAVSIGDPNIATGQGATALGKDNTSTGDGAIAIGYVNTANQKGAAAIGYQNNANGEGAVALGDNNTATGAGAIAIGSDNSVTGDGSLALGNNIRTGADDTLAIGSSTSALAERALALGNRASARSVDTLAVGTDSSAAGQAASAIGIGALASGSFSAVFGSNSSAIGDYTMALGPQSTATAEGALAIGSLSQASGFASSALGSGAVADEEGSVALGSATKTVRGVNTAYTAFGLAIAQNSQGEIAIARNLSYLDPATGLQTPTGDRQITGLAAGSADTDAVNVSQLRGVSSTLGNAFATGLGGGATYNSTTGQIVAPSYTFGGVTYTNVGDALQALSGTGTGTGTGGGGSTPPTTSGNPVTYASTDQSTVTLATTGTLVTNVAAGEVSATSSDAVNGAQLNATNNQVSQLSTQVNNGAIGVVRYANAATPTQANGGTQSNDATLVGANAAAPVALHNVASGSVAEASTDAVNGGQLYATNQAVSRAQSTADTAMTMSQNSVQYDSPAATSVTLGNATSGAVALHNVADGQSPRDAVNLGQMNAAVAGAVAQSNSYTDGRVAALAFDLRKVNRTANAGVAGAMALAGMPQPYEAGRGMVSMGMATYQGQTAVAFGASKAFSDEHTVMKVGATYNSSGSVGVSVGAGYQF